MDWNLSLSSFESHILSVRNLIDLALSSPLPSPARLIFMSSIATIRGEDIGSRLLRSSALIFYTGEQSLEPIKEGFVPPESGIENGYSESKWVCEHLLEVASAETPLRSVVIRGGQITGSPSGAWNTSEWLPSLVRSSVYLKALPSVDKVHLISTYFKCFNY